ncbi:MAG: UDP-N-acetylmuramate:L-alanyl-gamma-D-glutamyl-meso-diaminopimelate ligase [Cytophagales bacterium]|nr:UDP-N-acetylmuramate:L-alanyl-gamma-D-glutamyl-meso-diaminopimelate ligase [Cytophagales bacterium]
MHIHILGICGTFMGGLAALARAAGHKVTGCDTGVYPPMSDQLRALGIELIEGYDSAQLALNPDVWVVGNVVSRAQLADGSPRYPLMEAILDRGDRYTSGPEWLSAHILQGKHVLAVAGTHGKTTTSSMLAWVLECAGLHPSFLIGGVPLNFGVSARLTDSKYFVIEADEYDTAFFDKRSKFVHYRPRTAVLNNLEFDHADIFPNLEAIERQFHHLVRTVPSNGRVVVNGDEPALARVLAQGCWSSTAKFSKTDALIEGIEWQLSGLHNRMNALAAIAAAAHVGVKQGEALRALATFENVKRRMEVKGTVATPNGSITVIDDFAHHPTAIATTLDGLRRQLDAQGKQSERILAIFEPRSNTMKLGAMKSQLPQALTDADLAFCHSGGLDWDAQAALASMGSRAVVASPIDELVRLVVAQARAGDHLLCMSNGGFGGIHQKLLEGLKNKIPM